MDATWFLITVASAAAIVWIAVALSIRSRRRSGRPRKYRRPHGDWSFSGTTAATPFLDDHVWSNVILPADSDTGSHDHGAHAACAEVNHTGLDHGSCDSWLSDSGGGDFGGGDH